MWWLRDCRGGVTPYGTVRFQLAQVLSHAEVISIWVGTVLDGRGVATAIITAIASWPASIGAATLTLFVMPDHVATRSDQIRHALGGDLGPEARARPNRPPNAAETRQLQLPLTLIYPRARDCKKNGGNGVA